MGFTVMLKFSFFLLTVAISHIEQASAGYTLQAVKLFLGR